MDLRLIEVPPIAAGLETYSPLWPTAPPGSAATVSPTEWADRAAVASVTNILRWWSRHGVALPEPREVLVEERRLYLTDGLDWVDFRNKVPVRGYVVGDVDAATRTRYEIPE